MASGEVLPWLATRGGAPISPTGLSSEGPDLGVLIAQALEKYERLLLWDLDGIERGRPHLELYRRFEGKGLWVDGGVESVDGLIDILVAGAKVAVLNLRTLPSLEHLYEAGKMTDEVALCVEEGQAVLTRDQRYRNSKPIDLFREARRAGISRGVYLHDSGLQEVPRWVDSLEGMSLFAGPASSHRDEKARISWRAVVDVYELI